MGELDALYLGENLDTGAIDVVADAAALPTAVEAPVVPTRPVPVALPSERERAPWYAHLAVAAHMVPRMRPWWLRWWEWAATLLCVALGSAAIFLLVRWWGV